MGLESGITCPACGANLYLPEGKNHFFCSECGRPVDLELARAVQAARRGARAAIAAQEAAQESLRVAQEQARIAAEQVAANHQQIEEQTVRWEAERQARERAAAEARAQAEAYAQSQTAAQQQAEAQTAAQWQVQAAVQDVPHDTGVEPDGTIRDRASGCGLFWVRMPDGWAVTNTELVSTGSSSRPYRASVWMRVPRGGLATMRQGAAGSRTGGALKLMMSTYGGATTAVDTTNYADMPDPIALADAQAIQVAQTLGGAELSYFGQLAPQNIEASRQEALELFRRTAHMTTGMPQTIGNPYAAEVIRVFRLIRNGHPWRIATYVLLFAAKLSSEAAGLGEALSSLFGRRHQEDTAGAVGGALGSSWCTEDFASYVRSGTIFWSVEREATLALPEEVFDQEFYHSFLPLVESSLVHRDLESRTDEVVLHEAAAIQGATNVAVQGMNMRTQAALEANRQVQAAFDAKNASWQAASNAHHQQFRQTTNAQFAGPSAGGGVGDFSEAIRGVNTYATSDGREVEVSVRAEHVYENPGGDVYATDSHFDPGGDWTEIGRV